MRTLLQALYTEGYKLPGDENAETKKTRKLLRGKMITRAGNKIGKSKILNTCEMRDEESIFKTFARFILNNCQLGIVLIL